MDCTESDMLNDVVAVISSDLAGGQVWLSVISYVSDISSLSLAQSVFLVLMKCIKTEFAIAVGVCSNSADILAQKVYWNDV